MDGPRLIILRKTNSLGDCKQKPRINTDRREDASARLAPACLERGAHSQRGRPIATESIAKEQIEREITEAIEAIGAMLQMLAHILRDAAEQERAYEKPSVLHERLAEIQQAAELLKERLLDRRIAALLEIEDVTSVCKVLHELATKAESVRLANPLRQGLRKVLPRTPTMPRPMECCALIAASINYLAKGRWPGNKNTHVQRLCEKLWTFANGPRPRVGDNPESVEAWYNHLRASRKFRPPHYAGTFIVERVLKPAIEGAGKRKSARAAEILFRALVDREFSYP